MSRSRSRARASLFAVCLGASLVLALALADGALARPGGGDSWSGGGGGSYGGGGGGGGGGDDRAIIQLVFVLLQLCFEYPVIGIPLTLIVLGFIAYSKMQSPSDASWNSAPPVPVKKAITLDALRRIDPDFSQIVFEDFCVRLYAQAQMARASQERMAELAPYLRPEAQQALVGRAPGTYVPVSNVIVGALRVFRVDLPTGTQDGHDYARVGIELETNYTLGAQGQPRTMYAIEQWVLARKASARTKPPKTANRFPCPNCGAPFETSDGTRCNYCGEIVNNGRFDWVVTSVTLMHERQQPPTLTTEVPEHGTSLPTVYQPNVGKAWTTLLHEDPALSEPAFFERARLVHRELTAGWTSNDLRGARPYVSDGLFDYLRYWVETYQRAGLRNVLEQSTIEHAELAKVTRDRYYDAVTLRVFGNGLDYVVDASGNVVKGSKRKKRPYSEYWTLVRGSHARGAPRTDKACPSCGAPLQISMAGTCEYCQTHVTAGEFDWVLSKIEQDDTYRG